MESYYNKNYPPDKKILLSVADGPEGIEIYSSEHESIIDFMGNECVYLTASVNGASVKIGPFALPSILRQIKDRIK